MGGGHLRRRLKFLWFRKSARDPHRWLNDAPRPPPIPLTNRISDASSALTDVTNITTGATLDLKSTRNSNLGAVCLICLDDLPIGSSRIKLPKCAHSLWHAHCVRTWLRHSPRCPLCATVVTSTIRTTPMPSPRDTDGPGDDAAPDLSNAIDVSPRVVSLPATIMPSASCPPATGLEPSSEPQARDLPWTLSERRVHERTLPDLRQTRLSSHELEWFLYDRRLSRVSRPVRRYRYPRLSSLSNTFSIVRR